MTHTAEEAHQKARIDAVLDRLGAVNRLEAALPELERLGLPDRRTTVTDVLARAGRTWEDVGLREEDATYVEEVFARAAMAAG
ncbi:hypothetical protein [Streptomyces asiaticus]|uniref:hypothetical protein n=1 Tax=Streptomyces asiaticus TaxID=114695 RepID=UPI0038260DDF